MMADPDIRRPDPDPTVLTTAQLFRTVGDLKQIIFIRLDAMDKAMTLFNENMTRVPTAVDKQVAQLAELVAAKIDVIRQTFMTVEEKFASIGTQFKERDVRVEQTARDTKVAVDAALQAAEKAVGKQNEASGLSIAKSENATNKQIDQLGELLKTNQSATADKIDDLKERLLRLEGADQGQKAAVTSQRATTTSVAQVIGVVAAVVLGVVSLVVTVAFHVSGVR